jgi:hypothetical protein
MVRVTIVINGEKMRIPVRDNETVRAFVDDMLGRMERLHDPLVAALRNGTQSIGAIVSKSDQRIVATLPADDDELLVNRLDANTTELVAVLASEMVRRNNNDQRRRRRRVLRVFAVCSGGCSLEVDRLLAIVFFFSHAPLFASVRRVGHR